MKRMTKFFRYENKKENEDEKQFKDRKKAEIKEREENSELTKLYKKTII